MEFLRFIQKERRGNPGIRTLLAEIKRMHEVFAQIEHHRKTIDAEWHAEIGGSLVALHHLKILLSQEPAMIAKREQTTGIQITSPRQESR